jgi:hypothetical protein
MLKISVRVKVHFVQIHVRIQVNAINKDGNKCHGKVDAQLKIMTYKWLCSNVTSTRTVNILFAWKTSQMRGSTQIWHNILKSERMTCSSISATTSSNPYLRHRIHERTMRRNLNHEARRWRHQTDNIGRWRHHHIQEKGRWRHQTQKIGRWRHQTQSLDRWRHQKSTRRDGDVIKSNRTDCDVINSTRTHNDVTIRSWAVLRPRQAVPLQRRIPHSLPAQPAKGQF